VTLADAIQVLLKSRNDGDLPSVEPMTLSDAIQVLSAAQHRGARSWRYDYQTMRVLPEGWNGLTEAAPPNYTPWEALTLARRLVEIGAADARQPAKDVPS
jgi:hypothetical protein